MHGERVTAVAQKASRSPSKAMRKDKTNLRPEKASLYADMRASTGQPLDGALRTVLERGDYPSTAGGPVGGRSGFERLEALADRPAGRDDCQINSGMHPHARADFASVRLHSDHHAQTAARRLRARAFTFGDGIFVDPAAMPAAASQRRELLAHETAHVAQQRDLGRRIIQPRLIVTGSAADIQRFLDIAEPAMGEDLEHDPVTNEITAVASLPTAATSPVFAAAMHTIIDDPAQDAEANFGTAQAGVVVGAFPVPSDMTGATVQNVDIDDIEVIEAGAPGNGLAALAHELTENYTAHGAIAAPGVDQFGPAHEAAISTESDVAEDVVGPGRRVAEVVAPGVGTTSTMVVDYQNYYLTFDMTQTGTDFALSNAQQAARINISTHTIDSFATGSDLVPAAGAGTVAAIAADIAANPTATALIQGFTDDVGNPVNNIILSSDRADSVVADLVAVGIDPGRLHTEALGESNFVAPNDTDANRARNRRVVVTIDRPDI